MAKKIDVNKSDINPHLLPVLKGSDAYGHYLKDSLFFRRLIEYFEGKEIEQPPYTEFENLYSFQSKALSKIIERGSLLLNLSPGLGKTYVASKLIDLTPIANIIIIAPKSLHYIWLDHISRLTNRVPTHRSKIYHGGTLITNIEQLSVIDFQVLPTLLIVDESIVIKNRKSGNFTNIKSLLGKVPFKLLLSGSPYSKNISDMWAQLNFLFPKDFTSFWDFAKIFCNVVVDQYGWKIEGNKRDIESMLSYALQDYMFSAHIDDVIDLPDYTHYIIDIPPTKEQITAYDTLKKKFIYEDPDQEVVIEALGSLALLTRLKQLSISPKVFFNLSTSDSKMEYLKSLLPDIEYPAILISSSNKILNALSSEYQNSTIFNADNPTGYESFLSGDKDLLLMQIASGKFGHSFTNTKSVIYIDYTFNSDDYYQSLARTKRLNSIYPVSIYHLHCLPIDKSMHNLNKNRSISVDNLMKEINSEK